MATYTTYLNLEKPTTSETFNLLKMNQNWDKIDAGVSALNSNFINNSIRAFGDRRPLTFSLSYNRTGFDLNLGNVGNRWGLGLVMVGAALFFVTFDGNNTVVKSLGADVNITVTYDSSAPKYSISTSVTGQISAIIFGGLTNDATITAHSN